MIGERCAEITEGWLWWATFRHAMGRGLGVVQAAAVANAAVSDMWKRYE